MAAIQPGAAGAALAALAEGLAPPRAALEVAAVPVDTDAQRGLDHGAWVPLRYLFPKANVPIVPLSIQHHDGPQHAYRVGQALAPLAAQRFSDWIHGQLISGDISALLEYRHHNPDALRAQPRDERLLPLFTALGAVGAGALPRAIHRGISDHVIAMDGYGFEPLSAH